MRSGSRQNRELSRRQRIVSATIASAGSTFVFILYQLVSLPLFLASYGSARYSDWLIMFGLPALLSVSDLGVPDVVGSQMTMLRSSGSVDEARVVFRRTRKLAIIWLGLLALVLAAAIWAADPAMLLHLHATSETSARLTLSALGAWLVLNLYWGMYAAAYQSVLKFHRNLRIFAIVRTGEFGALLAAAAFASSLPIVAGSILAVRMVATAFVAADIRRETPWYERTSLTDASVTTNLRKLISPAIASTAFPLGNAIQNQGLLVILGWRSTAATVVLVNSIRTITNGSYQMNTFLKAGITPELSDRFGANDIAGARSLAVKSTAVVTLANIVFACGVAALGSLFLRVWSDGRLSVSVFVMTLFALSATTDCVWHSMSNVAQSKNVHQRIAASYFLACLMVLPLCYVLAPDNGAAGVALSLFTTSVIVNAVTVPTTASILQTTVGGYSRESVQFAVRLTRTFPARLSRVSQRLRLS